jgi:hypothetical protein
MAFTYALHQSFMAHMAHFTGSNDDETGSFVRPRIGLCGCSLVQLCDLFERVKECCAIGTSVIY